MPSLVHLLTFWADLFDVSPVPKCYHTPCECAEIRDGLRILVPTVGLELKRCFGSLWNEEGENGPMNGTTREGRSPAQGRGRTPGRVTGTQAPVLCEGRPYPRQSPSRMKEPLQEQVSIPPRLWQLEFLRKPITCV